MNILALILMGTAIFRYDTVDGMYRTCYYDFRGSTVTKTIERQYVCPPTIEVDDGS